MKYDKIKFEDMNNGPGLRTVIWVSGCEFACPFCFNERLWNFEEGDNFGQEQIDIILKSLDNDYVDGVTFLGGEPLHKRNVDTMQSLAAKIKEMYPNKTIWCYTGHLFKDVEHLEILNYIDVLVDGRFVMKLFDPNYQYAGSTNQRIIDIKKTKEQGEIVLWGKK